MLWQMQEFLDNIPVPIHCYYSFITDHLDSFYSLAIVNNAAVYTGLQILFLGDDFVFSGVYKKRNCWLCHSSIFNLFRNFYAVFPQWLHNLHPREQYIRVPSSPHLHQLLISPIIFLVA